MAHLTNFSVEFFYDIVAEDASLFLLYHGAKESKMTKNSNQGGGDGGPTLKGIQQTQLYLKQIYSSKFTWKRKGVWKQPYL